MKKNEKNKKSFVKKRYIILTAAVVLIAAYVIFQAVLYSSGTLDTETVYLRTHDDNVSGEAFVVRDEEILTNTENGVLNYSADNGARVKKDGTVAVVYSTENEAGARRTADRLQENIDRLSRLQASGRYFSSDPSLIKNKITETLGNMLDITDGSNLDGFSGYGSEMLSYMNELQMATGEASDFTAAINKLKAEKADCESRVSGGVASVKSPISGYFVNHADGYENLILPKSVTEITPDKVSKALSSTAKTVDKSTIGKIIAGYEWYVVMKIPASDAEKITVDKDVTVGFTGTGENEVPARVCALNYDKTNENAALVLQLSYMSSALSSIRKENVKVRVKTYEGIAVNEDAIRIVDGVKGVYTVSGITAHFVPVDMLTSYSGTVLCKYEPSDSTRLKIYDEVIIKGRDLYDGKAVR